MFESELALFSVAGTDGYFRRVNSAFEKLLGYSHDELLSRSIFELVPPADIPRLLEELARLEDEAGEAAFENRWLHKNGGIRHIAWVAYFDNAQQLWFATARDVSEERLRQQAHAETADRLRFALEASQAGIWDWQAADGQLHLDTAARRLLGMDGSGDCPLQRTLRLVAHPDRSHVAADVRDALARGGDFELSFNLAAAPRHVSLRGRVITDHRGHVQRATGVVLDTTARKAEEDRLLELANNDGLTGVRNRRSFDQILERDWQRCLRQASQLSMLMLDVDDFKRYNDHYGHQAGDRCLIAVAQTLQGCARRSNDVVARYGGEEFVVLLPHTGLDDACQLAEAIRAAVEALRVPQHDGRPVTISVGVANVYPLPDSHPQQLVQQADTAMYAAKAAGKNRVVSAAGDAHGMP